MSSPYRYDDGSYRIPYQVGTTIFSSPFVDKGDSVSWMAKMTFVQDAPYYVPTRISFVRRFTRGSAYLVNISDTADIGNGLLQWEETYAPVPQKRTEYGSVTYTQQFIEQIPRDDGGFNFGLVEWTNTRDASIIYEYNFRTPLPRLLSPKAIQQGNKVYLEGRFGLFTEGQSILARDTESDIWNGQIYVRKSTYIQYHNFVQLQ